ncbi:unnamed protein product, partial [Anisakis simplex]|uniref:GLOBIN domain-containing protein n=1 Tax=Anisakis simplex TaxID=6269 RepID=A0A0M3J8H7_ANISI
MTSGQFGVNVLHALLRKDPSLIDALRPIEQGGDLDDEEEPLRQTAGGPIQRKSFDLLTYPQYYQAGERIVTLFDDLMQMMQNQHAEQEIIKRIRSVGATHAKQKLIFNSCVWREFKSSILGMVAECGYDSDATRVETLNAWSSLISLVIRE